MSPSPTWVISPSDLDFAVVDYAFGAFTDNEQSELPGLEGAIDITLLDYAGSIADQTILIASLFDGLDDVFNILGEIDSSDDIGNTLADLANSAAAGDATLGDYAGQIGGSTSGGGGGGSTTACDVDTQASAAPVSAGVHPVQYNWQNSSNATVTVTSMSIKGQTGSGWSVQVTLPFSIPPGQTRPFNILLDTSNAGTFDAVLTVNESDFANPRTYCIHVGVQTNPSGGGGGTGGCPPQGCPIFGG